MPLQVPRILWAALIASTVVFLVVLLVLRPAPPEPPPLMMFPGFAVTAVLLLVASVFVPRMTIRNAVLQSKPEVTEETIEDPARAASDVLPYRDTATLTRKVAKNPKKARRKALVIYQTSFILGMALSEAVALFGFVLHFLGFPLSWALPFFGACWISMALRFPTVERVLGPYERAAGLHIPRA